MSKETQPTPAKPRWIRAKDLTQRLGVHRITIYRWVQLGAFPAPRHLGGTRTVFWSAEEVEAWEARQLDAPVTPSSLNPHPATLKGPTP